MTVVDAFIQASASLINDHQNFVEVTGEQVLGGYTAVSTLIGRWLTVWNWRKWAGPITGWMFGGLLAVLFGMLRVISGKQNQVCLELVKALEDPDAVWDEQHKELLSGGVVFKQRWESEAWILKSAKVGEDEVLGQLSPRQVRYVNSRLKVVVDKITKEDKERKEQEAAEKLRKARTRV